MVVFFFTGGEGGICTCGCGCCCRVFGVVVAEVGVTGNASVKKDVDGGGVPGM